MAHHIYLIGALRNPGVPELAVKLRAQGHIVFDDWHAAGPTADEEWQKYEQLRGRVYQEALYGHHANNTFNFDVRHLRRCNVGVLVLPCGKSGHLELGWMLGRGCSGYVFFSEEPARWDLMYRFATAVCFSEGELFQRLNHADDGTMVSLRAQKPGDPNAGQGVEAPCDTDA